MRTGPDADRARLLACIGAAWTTQAVAAACELALADRLAHGPATAAVLAQQVRADADALERLLRALSTLEITQVLDDGRFALGPLGELLRHDHPQGLRHWALLNAGPLWRRWSGLPARVRTGQHAPGAPGTADRFARLDTDAHEAALFHGAMAELSRGLVPALARQLALPGAPLVVDVGGGSGELLAGLLARHPAARGLLFDLAGALVHAPAVLQRHAVGRRCALQAGSFLDAVPPGGDVYLLKSVLHDWDDAQALRLLRHCRAAMRPGARLAVIERLMPARLAPSEEHRALARSDLNMLVNLAGRERRQDEHAALCAAAGLALHAVQPLALGFSLLQVGAAAPAGASDEQIRTLRQP